jgi:outer membrane protein OmpA-like peptidoglycan-associated protein
LAACQTQPGQNTAVGAGLGALGGAAVGAAIDDGGLGGALLGAGIGALAGGAVGNYMDRQEQALRQDLAGTGVDVKRQGDVIVLNMPGNITFATDSAQISSQFYPTLNEIGQTLRNYPQTTVQVVGHTDNTGSSDYNVDLSLRRANSVVQYLQSQGVTPQRVAAYGAGEAQPIATNATPQGRQANRRVEITIQPYTG